MKSLLAALVLVSVCTAPALAAKAIPKPPYYYVQDEAKILPDATLRAVQSLLIEHDRIAGEQILFAVFDSLDGEDLVDFTNRVFKEWKIGKKGKDNGVLLALYWKEHQARIEVGYGLEPTLTDAKSAHVLGDVLIPLLKQNQPGEALSQAALEILTILESPLISNGKAVEILKSGGYQGIEPDTSGARTTGTAGALLLAIIFLAVAIHVITSREAHFSGNGWSRSNPLSRGWRTRPSGGGILAALLSGFFGGGGGGGGGGFGGFSGGGGSSGGGGASGSW